MARTRLGKYRLIAGFGRGAMAYVYLALAEGPDDFRKLIVVKQLRPMLAHDPETRAQFSAEARLAARLNHPNVVQTNEVCIADGDLFLTMEYMEGQSLLQVTSSKPRLPLEYHLRILADTLAGLHYAHQLADYDGTPLHAVHRDVSANNVFVTYDGQVKLLDFGIAKAVGRTITIESGVIRGTLGYIAPEQILALEVDRRADIYSVGVLLWEALTRRSITKGLNEVALLQRALDDQVPRPRSVESGAPEALERICMKAMARQPADRFATAAEMQSALEDFLHAASPGFTNRDIGKHVATVFAESRTLLRAAIDAHVRSANDTPPLSAESIERVVGARLQVEDVRDREDVGAVDGGTVGGAVKGAKAPPTARWTFRSVAQRSGRIVIRGAVAVLAIAIAGGVWITTRQAPPRVEPPSPAYLAPPSLSSTALVPPPEHAGPASTQLVAPAAEMRRTPVPAASTDAQVAPVMKSHPKRPMSHVPPAAPSTATKSPTPPPPSVPSPTPPIDTAVPWEQP